MARVTRVSDHYIWFAVEGAETRLAWAELIDRSRALSLYLGLYGEALCLARRDGIFRAENARSAGRS